MMPQFGVSLTFGNYSPRVVNFAPRVVMYPPRVVYCAPRVLLSIVMIVI
jgi:hypothetical protein